MERRLYVTTRRNYSSGYKAVQSGHAVAQFLLDNPEQDWDNNYLIFTETKDLELLMLKLNRSKIPFSHFREPDLGGETTAIACYHPEARRLFSKLQLVS